jgi:plasmid stability protein
MNLAILPRMGRPIQVRDVPDDVHAALAAKARANGVSLSAYLRAVLEREARGPALREVLRRTGGHAPDIALDEIVGAIHEGRRHT